MKSTIAATTTVFASLAAAGPATWGAAGRSCYTGYVPITASARNAVFNQIIPVTDIQVTDFVLNNTQQGVNYTLDILEGYTTVSGNYSINYEYCQPDNATQPDIVQLLTHGIGFEKSYWDLEYDNYNYSYVSRALDMGYATFAWDRLGIGMSSHGNALTEIQALLEVDALKVLTNYLREGKIPKTKAFDKVVHVGHSFGSEHTYALTAMYPNISDGIALTGFSQNGSFVPYFMLGNDLVQANTVSAALKTYSDGYLAAGNAAGVQTNFFSPGLFSAEILNLATNVIGAPVTVGELLTIGGETGSTNYFKGPVLIITGQRDVPYCGGNCYAAPTGYSSIPEQAFTTFPDASNKTAVIVPASGHALNLEYTHPFTFETILSFFESNGLSA